jgi:vacuolar-type H+-ATPase subunit H
MPTKKITDAKKKTEETAKKVKTTTKKAVEEIENTAEEVAKDTKKVAHHTEEKAKELLNEGKKSVESLMNKYVDEDQINGYWDDIAMKFKTATPKDWVVFAVGVIALIWALAQLWEFVLGIILLLVAIVLINMFFVRK